MTISVLGLGGAGGNIANEASLLGIHAAAINFSQRDLNSASDLKYKLKVPGSDGVGHDRGLAIRLMQDHHEMVYRFVQEHFGSPSYDIVFVVFAAGGGSGAGMAPMLLDLLTELMPEKVYVAVPIIPSTSEAPFSQANTSATVAEIMNLGLCVLPIDNDQVPGGKEEQYRETNTRFTSFLFDLVTFTERESRNGNFDRTDLATLFRQPGMALGAEADITAIKGARVDITPSGIAATIQKSWDSSVHIPPSSRSIKKAALIYDGQESLINSISSDDIFSYFGSTLLDLFEGYYDSDRGGRVVTVLTGLQFPTERFDKIDSIIEAAGATLEEEEIVYRPKAVNLNQSPRRPIQSAGVGLPKKGVTDILSKYRR